MDSADRPSRTYRYMTGDPAVDEQFAGLVRNFGDPFDRVLLAELLASVYRLGQDGSSTGDLKILNAALRELRYAFKIFRPYRRVRKVAVFGSARVSSDHEAYGMARTFGRLMAKADWMVITGAASGIMKAGHEGSGRDASFGLNIQLPFEQLANPVIAKDAKLVNCKYFFTRKLLFIKESHATVLFPGGFGTFDEGFESLTLVQTGKSDPRPIIFVETKRPFWKPLSAFLNHTLVREGMVSASDRALYQVAYSAEEAAAMIERFYSVYHSLRYVGEQVVLRLQHVLPEATLASLNEEFKDLVSSGRMTQGKALPQEANDPDVADLPRLVFRFNRREFGRLVQLIHRINEPGSAAPRPARRRPTRRSRRR